MEEEASGGVMCAGGMCRDHVAEGIMCLEEEASGGVMCEGVCAGIMLQNGSCVWRRRHVEG